MSSPQTNRADKDGDAAAGRRVVTRVTSLASLVGAHPDALRAIFAAGRPTDPAELGDQPRGLLLSAGDGSELFLLTRPLVRLLGKGVLPWDGKVFDHGGNSGKNLFLGRQAVRFRAETVPSELDGKPALRLFFAEPAHRNLWPFRALTEELRTVGAGIAIGPALFHGRGASPRLLSWVGLEARS